MTLAIIPKPPELEDFFLTYPPSFHTVLTHICKSSQALDVLNQIVSRLGKIAILEGDGKGENALWSWKTKTISIDPSSISSYENKMAYILFELCNAEKTKEFQETAQKITSVEDVEDFVERIERIEHQSALKAQEIAFTILGKNAEFDFKYVPKDFNLHFVLQQISGHSEQIAKWAFPNSTFRGNLVHPLSQLDKKARSLIYTLLYYKQRNSVRLQDSLLFMKNNAPNIPSYQKAIECVSALIVE